MSRAPFLLVLSWFLAACGSKSDEEQCATFCGGCSEQFVVIGLDDMTSAGTPRERLEQAGVDLSGAPNLHTGELVWHGGGGSALVDASPSEGTTTFEAGLSYAGGQAYVDEGGCSEPGLQVELQLTLRTADGALAESWPVRALAFPDETGGLKVHHDVELTELEGTFTATATDPNFPILQTTVNAEFLEGRHDGNIEIFAMIEETVGPDGSIMGGGAGPAIVATWSTEPDDGGTTGGTGG